MLIAAGFTRGQPRPSRRPRVLALCAGATLALIAAVGIWTLSASAFRHGGASAPSATEQAAFEEATGIQLVRITISAGGGMLDLRYRVLDPDRAVVVHDKTKPPTIISEATGQRASQPWMPHHGGGNLKFAITYYELLMNPDGIIKRGDRVTLVVGDARLPHVAVQ